MAQLASDVGNQAFSSTLGRSPLAREAEQGAGINARRHRPRRRAVEDRLHARRRDQPRPRRRPRARQSLGDLSDVRVHTDDTADKLNRSVSARAFATGTDVYFARGEYSPGSATGDKLIAHELAHVVQQRGAGASGPLTVSQPGDAMEREADAVADQIALMAAEQVQRRLRLHRPPRDGRGRARRVERPQPGRPVPRPLHLRRPRARAEPRRLGLRRRRPARAGHRGARARPARRRRARDLRRAGAQPALRPPVRLPAGRRHPQAPEPAPRRPPAVRRGRLRRRRDAGVRARRRRCARRARSGSRATRRRRSPSGRSSSPTGSPRTCSASAWTTRRPAASCAWSRSPTTTPAATRRSQRSPRCSAPPVARSRSCSPGPDAEALVGEGVRARRSSSRTSARSTSPRRWPRRR